MKKFNKPEFKIIKSDKDKKYAEILVEPLERGFATTLGNAIRRTLLSATPGPAIFGVKIKGASHEFISIKGVVENVAKIILNIKSIILKIDTELYANEEEIELNLVADSKGVVRAKDIKLPNGVEILNPELIIAHLETDGKLNIALYAKISSGYKTFKDNKIICKRISNDVISIDSNYSPIEKVNFSFDDTKVGGDNDLEKLILKIETNGSISSIDSIAVACKILIDHLQLFLNLDFPFKEENIFSADKEHEEDNLNKTIDELDFSQRSRNCLKSNRIFALKDLVTKTEDEIKGIKNLGKKSFNEIRDKLKELDLFFKQI